MIQVGIDIHPEALLDRGRRALLRRGLFTAVWPGVTALALPTNGLALLTSRGARPQQAGQLLLEVGAGLREKSPVLRTRRASHTGFDRRKIERGGLRVFGLRRIRRVEPSLLCRI